MMGYELAIVLLVALGAQPVDLPTSSRPGALTTPLPVVVRDCDYSAIPLGGLAKCREGRVTYTGGKVAYEGELPINDAVKVLLQHAKGNVK